MAEGQIFILRISWLHNRGQILILRILLVADLPKAVLLKSGLLKQLVEALRVARLSAREENRRFRVSCGLEWTESIFFWA